MLKKLIYFDFLILLKQVKNENESVMIEPTTKPIQDEKVGTLSNINTDVNNNTSANANNANLSDTTDSDLSDSNYNTLIQHKADEIEEVKNKKKPKIIKKIKITNDNYIPSLDIDTDPESESDQDVIIPIKGLLDKYEDDDDEILLLDNNQDNDPFEYDVKDNFVHVADLNADFLSQINHNEIVNLSQKPAIKSRDLNFDDLDVNGVSSSSDSFSDDNDDTNELINPYGGNVHQSSNATFSDDDTVSMSSKEEQDEEEDYEEQEDEEEDYEEQEDFEDHEEEEKKIKKKKTRATT